MQKYPTRESNEFADEISKIIAKYSGKEIFKADSKQIGHEISKIITDNIFKGTLKF